jgi:hypothetical protein
MLPAEIGSISAENGQFTRDRRPEQDPFGHIEYPLVGLVLQL